MSSSTRSPSSPPSRTTVTPTTPSAGPPGSSGPAGGGPGRAIVLLGVSLVALVASVTLGGRGDRSASHDDARPTPRAVADVPSPVAPAPAPDETRSNGEPPPGPASLVPAVASDDPIEALRAGLASDDAATRIAAVEAAWHAGDLRALRILEKLDLARDPDVAPTAIRAIAELGAKAPTRDRDDAAHTLADWLASEQTRPAVDASGNVSMLVEALGNTGSGDAVDPLSRALDGGDLPLYVQTLAVQELASLGDARGAASVERFRSRVASLPPGEGIDAELRTEAASAADDALRRLAL